MTDKTSRVLAIIALVFMGIFVVALTMTVVDYKLLHGSIGFIALGSGVFVAVIFIALKADGRGFSMTKINNDIEMAKIEKEIEERKKSADSSDTVDTESAPGGEKENSETQDGSDGNKGENTPEESKE